MKYKLTNDKIKHGGCVLRRIRALRDVGKDVKAGDLGGYVGSEQNLSQYDDAWVCDDAMVFGGARVCDGAMVYSDACVYGDARVCDGARVYGDACVYGDARVYGRARVYGTAEIYGNAEICGRAWVRGDAEICGDAFVYRMGDYMVFTNTWSSYRSFTCFRVNDGSLRWRVGCFYGTGEELVEKEYKDSELSGDCYKAAVKMAESVFAMTRKKDDAGDA